MPQDRARASAYIKTFGCESNRADTEALLKILSDSGISLAASEESAEAIVINSCTVRGETEQKVLGYASSFPGKHVIITGCMAAVQPALIRAKAPFASIVSLCNSRLLPSIINAGGRAIAIKPGAAPPEPAPFTRGLTYTVPISRGCKGACSYCIIRFARGSLRSSNPDRIAKLVGEAVSAGAYEVRLAAQDTGVYGDDIGSSLPALLRLVSSVDGDFRIRVGMLNPLPPAQIDDLVSSYASRKVYKFAHMPLQSGSDRVLASMGRKYSCGDFAASVAAFRSRFPEITIATDVIVGYPGESEADFQLTLDAILKTRPAKIHVARFSPRPHTIAASMAQVPDSVKKRRSQELVKLKMRVQRSNNELWLGKTVSAFVFGSIGGRRMAARMDNYKPVLIEPCSPAILGRRVDVQVDSCTPFSLGGSIIRR